MRSRTRAVARIVLSSAVVTAAAFVGAAAPAAASSKQQSIFRDDAVLLWAGDERRERALDELKALGVDMIQAQITWRQVAPAMLERQRPAGFDAKDPAAYDPERWDKFDGLVRGARARGIRLMLGPTGPAPLWATGCDGKKTDRPQVCEPSVKEFQRFVIALARRYSGTYVDENGGGVLPRVKRWSIWNEPNQGGWLQPQWERRRGRWVPAAADRYRDLFAASVRGLRKYGHKRDQVFIGETAPLGRRSGAMYKRSMAPVDFWRALLCIDSRGRKLRGTYAKLIGCRKPKRLDAQGAAHHPYTRGGGKHPRTRKVYRDEITIAYMRRLQRELDRAARLKRVRRGMPIYSTEFGFQTDPPDDVIGVSPTTAARWMNEANWIAYNNRRVRGIAQYELLDAQDVASFQTGLRFHDGRAKPSYAAYRIPIWVVKTRRYYRVWGQVRPAAKGSTVQIQYRSGKTWKRVRTIEIRSSRGYINVKTRKRARRWRLEWRAPDGTLHHSRTAGPARR